MLNKVILIGNLGRDPEVRYLPSGDAVANFSIATSENWKDRNGQRQERTEWHNISMFGRLAEIAGQYLKKGSKVYIEGRIQSRKYQGHDGYQDRQPPLMLLNERRHRLIATDICLDVDPDRPQRHQSLIDSSRNVLSPFRDDIVPGLSDRLAGLARKLPEMAVTHIRRSTL